MGRPHQDAVKNPHQAYAGVVGHRVYRPSPLLGLLAAPIAIAVVTLLLLVVFLRALVAPVLLLVSGGHTQIVLVRGVGVLASIVGTYLVRGKSDDSGNAMRAIFQGFLTSAAISVVLFGAIAVFYMNDVPGGWWRPFLSTAVGVALAER